MLTEVNTPLDTRTAFAAETHAYAVVTDPPGLRAVSDFAASLGQQLVIPDPSIGFVMAAINLATGRIEGCRVLSAVMHFDCFAATSGAGVSFGAFDRALDHIVPAGVYYYTLVKADDARGLDAAERAGMRNVGTYVLMERVTEG